MQKRASKNDTRRIIFTLVNGFSSDLPDAQVMGVFFQMAVTETSRRI